MRNARDLDEVSSGLARMVPKSHKRVYQYDVQNTSIPQSQKRFHKREDYWNGDLFSWNKLFIVIVVSDYFISITAIKEHEESVLFAYES